MIWLSLILIVGGYVPLIGAIEIATDNGDARFSYFWWAYSTIIGSFGFAAMAFGALILAAEIGRFIAHLS